MYGRLRVLAALAAAFILPTAPSTAADSVLDQIKQRGELRVAGVLYRPLIAPRPNGEYVGIDVEVLKRMAADLGVKANFVQGEFATAVAGITAGKWDIIPAICITDARKQVIDFSETYITIGATFVSLTNNPKNLTTVEAFNRPEVVFAVPSGSWSEAVATEAAPKATRKAFGQTTSSDLVQEVVAGRADAVVLDTPIQITLARAAYPDKLRIVPGAEQPLEVKACKVGYGYMKGDDKFGAYINGFLKKMRDSGELEKINRQYMKPEMIKATN
jgi:ABC-type amino acid transport substrate-binding protein